MTHYNSDIRHYYREQTTSAHLGNLVVDDEVNVTPRLISLSDGRVSLPSRVGLTGI